MRGKEIKRKVEKKVEKILKVGVEKGRLIKKFYKGKEHRNKWKGKNKKEKGDGESTMLE